MTVFDMGRGFDWSWVDDLGLHHDGLGGMTEPMPEPDPIYGAVHDEVRVNLAPSALNRAALRSLCHLIEQHGAKVQLTEKQRVAMETLRGDWNEWAEVNGDHGEVRFAEVELNPSLYFVDGIDAALKNKEPYPPATYLFDMRDVYVGVELSRYPVDDEDILRWSDERWALAEMASSFVGLPLSQRYHQVDIRTEPTDIEYFQDFQDFHDAE